MKNKKPKKLKDFIFSPALLACIFFVVIIMVLLFYLSESETAGAVTADGSATYTTIATE